MITYQSLWAFPGQPEDRKKLDFSGHKTRKRHSPDVQQHGGGSGVTVYAKQDADTNLRNSILKERTNMRRKQSVEKSAEVRGSSEHTS